MKFSIIYAEKLARPRFLSVDSEDIESLKGMEMSSQLDPDSVFVYGVVDYENERVVPAAISAEGKIVEVPDGDYGILTPAEYFEEQS